ncbi:hypothetical protein MBLNU230_g5532t1 [Neophaeotheca triangularis]
MPSSEDRDQGDAQAQQNAVPHNIMLQQAGAAVSGNDDSTAAASPGERNAGRDVPLQRPETEDSLQDPPLPSYGEIFGSIEGEEQGLGTKATMADDGRVNIRIDQKSRRLSSLMVPALRHQIEVTEKEVPPPAAYIPPSLGGDDKTPPPPPMNLVIHVVGSRGDVQPFVALGKVLKDTYGHRVRLATHPNFKDFVTENGLEFFSIGGDPAKLMAFMVKNPGLMPGFDTLRNGDVGQRRHEINEMVRGCWRSCFETGDGLGPEVTDQTIEDWSSSAQTDYHANDLSSKPFVADAIIANPPSFAHIHCAEKLGIPLHVMFTMPYSPTQSFPHPLANIQSSNADPHIANFMSYALVDMMTWQGLGDVINRFRTKSLGLDPVPLMWAPGMLQRLKVPHTYCWSPALIPKPKDWGAHISISGFFFLNLASNFTPEPDLQAFLDAGPPPVYIGFGSIVLDDPNAMTKMIFEAVKKTGQRALVSQGWGGVGADELGIPEGVFMLGNVPHDWLFNHVSCVVHHGGAGTTAAGITAGRPTLVVPFFGDQQFWGSMVARAGAGPNPIPHKQLNADNLAEGIMTCLKPESLGKANELAQKIAKERGSDVGAQSFHQHLDVDKLRCTLAPSRIAVWRLKRTSVRLSALAACTLANEGLLDFNDLKLSRGREYETDEGPYEPISGAAGAIIGTMGSMMMGVADFPVETLKALKIHPDAQKKKPEPEAGESEVSTVASTSTETTETTDDKTLSSTKSSRESGQSSNVTTPSTTRNNSSFNVGESLAKIRSPPTPDTPGTPRQTTSNSMTEALQGRLGGRSNSRSRSRPSSRSGSEQRSQQQQAGGSGSGGSNPLATAMGTGKGVNRIVGAGLKSPMDFTMGLAKGFHNAPKLYGDETVRKPTQVTDFQSGMKAGWKELGLGFYDGISGLVTQPMRGAQKEGAAGFIKGIGKGIGGVALKPGAAIFGLPAYHMKGVYKELQSVFGSSVNNYIIAARTAQGYDDWQRSSSDEREDIISRWKELNKDMKKKKNPDEYLLAVLKEQREKGCHWASRLHPNRSWSGRSSRSNIPHPSAAHAQGSLPTISNADDSEFERAIQMSVQETSRGNPEEDAAIERAIRASMNELRSNQQQQSQPSGDQQQEQEDPDDEEALRRAMAASVAEAQRQTSRDVKDEDLEAALKASMAEQEQPAPPAYDDLGAQGSSKDPNAGHVAGATREAFEQQQEAQGGGEKSQAEKTEEQVVLEYVKKQSLLEQQHREGKGKEAAEGV